MNTSCNSNGRGSFNYGTDYRFKGICSINWGLQDLTIFFKALSKPCEELGRILVVLQNSGLATGVYLPQTQNIRPLHKDNASALFRERLQEIPKSLSQGWRKAPIY